MISGLASYRAQLKAARARRAKAEMDMNEYLYSAVYGVRFCGFQYGKPVILRDGNIPKVTRGALNNPEK